MSTENDNYQKETLIDKNSYAEIYKGKSKNSNEILLIEEINKEKYFSDMKENLTLEEIINNLNDEEKNSIIEKKETENLIYIIKKYNIKNIKLFTKKIQLTNINLTQIKTFPSEDEEIYSILTFPSGNLLVILSESIKIFNTEFEELQKILNAHEDIINSASVKDEDNFLTCSNDLKIKLWIKENNNFILYSCVENAHSDNINDVKYFLNGNFVSCSNDKIIKIWFDKNNNKEFQCKLSINNSFILYNLFLIEDKNILICMGEEGTIFYNFEHFQMLKKLDEVKVDLHGNQIDKFDGDKIIFGGEENLFIFSLSKNEIVNKIDIDFTCFSLFVIEEKGILVIIGDDEFIRVFRNDNFECICSIKGTEFGNMYGIFKLKNGLIGSFSEDDKIKIWKY